MFIMTTFSLYDYFVENSFCLDILKQLLCVSHLYLSASRLNWDKLTVSEMVQDIYTIGHWEYFYHIFQVYSRHTGT